MPLVVFVLGVIAAAAVWYWRMQAARDAAGELLDVANDVRLAARRFGYRRRHNVHPADSVDDARLAAMGIVAAITAMRGPATREQIIEMGLQAQSKFDVPRPQAEEIVTFGRWIITRCGSNDEAVRRLAKRLRDLAGPEALPDLHEMIARVNGGPPDQEQAVAIATLDRLAGGH
jgi:hypothetical protein